MLGLIMVVWVFATPLGVAPVPPAAAQTEPTTEAEGLADEVQQQWGVIEKLLADYAKAKGDERLVIDAQILRRAERIRKTLGLLIESVGEIEAAGETVERPRAVAEDLVASVLQLTRRELERIQEGITELARRRSEIDPEEALGLERKLTQAGVELDDHIDALYEFIGYKQTLNLDASSDLTDLDRRIQERADQLASEIEVVSSRVQETNGRLSRAEGSEAASIRAELTALQERLNLSTSSLEVTVRLLDKRRIAAAEYKQLLIRATGTVTTDILDTDVALGLAGEAWRNLRRWVASHAPQAFFNLLLFALIVFAFMFVARIVKRVLSRALARQEGRVPRLLGDMLIGVASKLVVILGVLIGLSQLGFEVAPLLAGLGVAGFIIGFALQDTLSNFASGMMILIYRPFDVGDVVDAGGVGGTVHHLSLVSTTILTFDNQRLVVPNRRIWGDVIRNKTVEDTRRVDLVFAASYEDDLAGAKRMLEEIVTSHELVLDQPEPLVRVHELKESSVEFIVRPWVKTEHYWKVYWDITHQVTACFDQHKLSVPYPRRDVLVRERPTAA
jgi:small conductance mechanosensitive channel